MFNSTLVYGQDNNNITTITGIKQDNISLNIPDTEVRQDRSQKENKNENIVREFYKNVFGLTDLRKNKLASVFTIIEIFCFIRTNQHFGRS